MYEAFYHLSAEPFRLSPDPAFSFQHRSYRKAMTYMLHALHRAEGFIMITGRPGTGKTTLINDLIRTLKPNEALVAKIVSTQLTADDLLHLVAYSFNLNVDGCSKAQVLVRVEHFLKQHYQQGRRPLLIVDEAQDMGEDALEELRLLTNILVGNHQLLQVFLVGQEQLRDTVNTPTLEQLHQRLIAATLLEPLNSVDTGAYIKHRLRRVNWRGDPLISTQAYAMIQRYSGGIPRRINQICSRLFLHGCIEERHRLGLADVGVVVEELQQELLLPVEKEEIDLIQASPEEQQEDTFEEETFDEKPPADPAEAETAPPDKNSLTDSANTGQPSATVMTGEPRSMPSGAAAYAAASEDSEQREDPSVQPDARTAVSWKLVGLGGLLTVLLVTLIYTSQSPFNRPADEYHVTAAHSEKTQTADTLQPQEKLSGNTGTEELPQPSTGSVEPVHSDVAVRQSTAPVPDADVPENPVESDQQLQLQATIQRQEEQPLVEKMPEPQQAQGEIQSNGQNQEHQQVQESGPEATPELEVQLRQNRLLIERLDSERLKVNLSSDGLFDFDSAEIKNGAHPTLNKLVDVLRKHDDLMVQIVGHTDSSGVAEYNLHLSQLRARAVAEYLVNQGLTGSSIRSEGRGDRDTRLEQPGSNDPRLKRRVEIYISRGQEY